LEFYRVILDHGVFNVCWFRKNERFYLKEARAIKERFPNLNFYTRGKDILVLKGNIEIKDGASVLDTYHIEILFPKTYPRDIPFLIETAGRIPRKADRHANGKAGICCIGPRLEQRQRWMKEATICTYIERFAIPFLANQSYYERVGEWKNGQYDHGAKGVLSYYAENFGLTNKRLLESILDCLAKNQKLGRNDACLCGSGKKAKKCHLEVFDKLRSDGCPELFTEDLKNLKKDTKLQNE